MIDINTLKVGDIVKFTDKTCKKFNSRKWQKEHCRFYEDLKKVLPINSFEVLAIDDIGIGITSIYIAGLFGWCILPEEIELVPKEELKNNNFVWLRGNYEQYKEWFEEYKRSCETNYVMRSKLWKKENGYF